MQRTALPNMPWGRAGAHGPTDAMRWVWGAVLFAYAILLTTFHYICTTPWWLASPWRMAGFDAAAPFQHRVLLPVIVDGVSQAVPWLDVDLLFAVAEVGAWVLLVIVAHRALAVFRIGTSDPARRLLAMTVVVPVAVHLIVPDVQIHSTLAANGGVLELGKWTLSPLFRYVYDLPAAVLTLALTVLLEWYRQTPDTRRLAAYLGVFAIATLNRETSVFMIPAFFAVCLPRLASGRLFKALAMQVAVYAVVQGTAQWFFAGIANPHANVPGTGYENHLAANLEMFLSPLYLLIFVGRTGAGLYLPVLLLRRHLNPTLGRTLFWFGIPFMGSALLFGRIQEPRVLIEIVPLIWLAAVQAISAWTTGHTRGRTVSCARWRGRRPASYLRPLYLVSDRAAGDASRASFCSPPPTRLPPPAGATSPRGDTNPRT